MTEKHHIAFRRSILAALLSVSTFFLPGCTASRPSGSANAPASGTGSSSKALEFKNVSSVSIASVLKDRNRDANEELLAGFDWFYDGYMKSGQSLEYMPKGAVSVTDPSRLDGEWMATHYRHPDDSWQKQILIADIQTEGDAVSYTETWQYIFFHDGSQQDARTAAHNLPYTGKAGRNPLTVSLTEAYFDNKLDYLNVYEYNGFLYAVGTYYSDYDKDSGFAAMYKAVDDFTPSAKPQPVTTEKPVEIKPSGSREEQADPNEVPETVPAPSGLEYLEETWKGGDYYFAIGNGAHEAVNNVLGAVDPTAQLVDHNGEAYSANADAVKKVTISEDYVTYKKSHYSDEVVENQFDDADYNYMVNKNGGTKITYLSRQDWESTWPKKITSNPAKNDDSNMSQYYKKTSETPSYKDGDGVEYNVPYMENDEKSTIEFTEMRNVPLEGIVEKGRFAGQEGAEVWDKFIKQMNLNDLVISVTDNRGILDVSKVNKMGNYVAEGPEGLLAKFKYGKEVRAATGFPTGPVYTGTFDHKMQEKYGGFFGEEALYCGVASVNAPGANINRTPYGSRASEYMSEDGILNYYTASNVVGAARKKGLIMNIKHCFLNNQETGRQRIHTYRNEQAIREIYLRPFEGALTRGHGLGIMTSYNRIGARYAACHEPLMKNVMRGEWAYKGLIIDDALPGSNNDSYSNGPAMLHCGTDLFCLDGNRGRDLKQWVIDNDDGTILADLQRANKYVMYALSRSWMGGVDQGNMGAAAWLNPTINGITIGAGVLTLAAFGMYVFGEITTKFLPKKKEEKAE